jgi:hypothetical protein
LIRCLFLPLVNLQLLAIYNTENVYFSQFIIITSLIAAAITLANKSWKLFLDAFTITQCILLIFICITHDSENFWLLSLSILVALNYFAIPELNERYCVPKEELYSVSIIFSNIFLIKSLH